MGKQDPNDQSASGVEHLWCDLCDSAVSVARRAGDVQLVCHCTHDDGPLSPVTGGVDAAPDAWRWLG